MIENYIQNSSIKQKTYPAKKAGNYRTFPQLTTKHFVEQGEKAFPVLIQNLEKDKHVVETLYILDRIQENKTGDCTKIYPQLSKLNKTKNPEVQTFLAGIYRKTQVPDAFGPLVSMLIQNAINPPKTYFDPNEEIGGAIISYLA